MEGENKQQRRSNQTAEETGSPIQDDDGGDELSETAEEHDEGSELSEGEIDDLEEGELKSDEESVTGSVRSVERASHRTTVRMSSTISNFRRCLLLHRVQPAPKTTVR
ncbi:unnamed protein product [Gongylonema pulchrum]|uniref:Uncharacterized protein n=1 Tax=Gongylonema pulchrum TaxID=637853 RepID=A0A3P7RM26_9BILA|nr:unnamed protein product [Gongylonema pulchrum]